MYISIWLYEYMYIYKFSYLSNDIYLNIYSYVYIYIHIHNCFKVFKNMYIYLYIHIYIYIQFFYYININNIKQISKFMFSVWLTCPHHIFVYIFTCALYMFVCQFACQFACQLDDYIIFVADKGHYPRLQCRSLRVQRRCLVASKPPQPYIRRGLPTIPRKRQRRQSWRSALPLRLCGAPSRTRAASAV